MCMGTPRSERPLPVPDDLTVLEDGVDQLDKRASSIPVESIEVRAVPQNTPGGPSNRLRTAAAQGFQRVAPYRS
ncbi:MAG: hypothetical protein RLZZ01_429 [Actinomycetota bacterium]